MIAKEIVRAIERNAPWQDVLCLVLWEEKTAKGFEESKVVVTPARGVAAIELKAIRKRVVPVKNLGWVVTLPVTKKTGAAIFVPRSRQALKSVRLLPVSSWRKHSPTPLKRWVTYAHS